MSELTATAHTQLLRIFVFILYIFCISTDCTSSVKLFMLVFLLIVMLLYFSHLHLRPCVSLELLLGAKKEEFDFAVKLYLTEHDNKHSDLPQETE